MQDSPSLIYLLDLHALQHTFSPDMQDTHTLSFFFTPRAPKAHTCDTVVVRNLAKTESKQLQENDLQKIYVVEL